MKRQETDWTDSNRGRSDAKNWDRDASGGSLRSGAHLTDDALLDQLYELNDHRSHLEECAECSARWHDMLEHRADLARPVEVSNELLWSQRRKIYARLGQERPLNLKWVPALAAAGLLAIGALVYRPAAPAPKLSPSNDAQLFSDAYSMEQSLDEPRAAAPIHALFEDNQ